MARLADDDFDADNMDPIALSPVGRRNLAARQCIGLLLTQSNAHKSSNIAPYARLYAPAGSIQSSAARVEWRAGALRVCGVRGSSAAATAAAT